MSYSHPIYLSIITIRSSLLSNRLPECCDQVFNDILSNLETIEVNSTRRIIQFCVPKAIEQVKNKNYRGAGFILNLLHNLPMDKAHFLRWNLNYFLTVELSTFINHREKVESFHAIFLFICKEIATDYFAKDTTSQPVKPALKYINILKQKFFQLIGR